MTLSFASFFPPLFFAHLIIIVLSGAKYLWPAFDALCVGVRQGIGGLLCVGTFQLVLHGCSLAMVQNQCPLQGQAAGKQRRVDLSSEVTRTI